MDHAGCIKKFGFNGIIAFAACDQNSLSLAKSKDKAQISIINDQNRTRQDFVWILEFWPLEFV
jgi:hypothetical protein